MKKIIIATDTWYPQMDGVVRHTEELIKNLKKQDFEIIVLHPRLFFSFALPFYKDYRVTFFAKSKITKIIEKEKPDYIHIATWGPLAMSVRKVCIEKKIKFTSTFPTHFPRYAKKYILNSGFLFNIVYSYLARFHNAGRRTMVSTKTLKKEAQNHGFKNVVVCPLGVDVDFFKKSPNIPEDILKIKHPIFVYLGRLAKEKNVEEFLRCDLPGTKLVIGDGPLRKVFEKKYSKDVIFVGKKTGRDLVDLLGACDVLVFTSITDTFGLTILEALSCEVPVAAHDVMGPKDIITNGVDGFISDNLQDAAQKCLKLSKENCRKKAIDFSWSKSAEIFIKNLILIK